MKSQRVHPALLRCPAKARWQFLRYRTIKRVEKSVLDSPAVALPGGETQQRAARISDDFLDIPTVSTHGDDVARGRTLAEARYGWGKSVYRVR
jgi:hypothetical protein